MRQIAAAVMMMVATMTLSSCESECSGLKATAQDREAAANGYEVEKKGNYGGTCELQRDGTWEVDD